MAVLMHTDVKDVALSIPSLSWDFGISLNYRQSKLSIRVKNERRDAHQKIAIWTTGSVTAILQTRWLWHSPDLSFDCVFRYLPPSSHGHRRVLIH